jgi:anti-sigma regulatory factor (Ser/Thr protein kinase)
VGSRIELSSTSGGSDGYRHDLPLERDLERPIVVDARRLGPCHPMFLVRLRLFLDWHLAAGHEITVVAPAHADVAQRLADLRFAVDLPDGVVDGLPPARSGASILGIHRLRTHLDAEAVAERAVTVLHEQVGPLAGWGDPLHMAVGELCDNALQHGHNDELGAYVAADRITEPRREFRLVIADLGIGIPEHIRARHPEWQDDSAAIARVLERGVTGTGDAERGNGFPETIEYALEQQLIQTGSAVEIDIRAASGRIGVDVIQGQVKVRDGLATDPRRGTWISYTVVTA